MVLSADFYFIDVFRTEYQILLYILLLTSRFLLFFEGFANELILRQKLTVCFVCIYTNFLAAESPYCNLKAQWKVCGISNGSKVFQVNLLTTLSLMTLAHAKSSKKFFENVNICMHEGNPASYVLKED